MAHDKALEMSDAQALAAQSDGATVVATDIIDMRTGLKDTWGTTDTPEIGNMVWNTKVHTALVGAGATVRCDLVTKAAATSMSSGSTVLASFIIPALAAAGQKYPVMMPPGKTTLRYVTVLYTAVGAKLTTATINSYLSLDNEVYD